VTELHRLTAHELLAGYSRRDFTPLEAVEALAARIEQTEPVLNAFFTTTFETARAEAVLAGKRWLEGSARPLEGVPFGVKDLFDTAGVRTTYGSPMYDGHVPSRDARAVELVREAGGILLGKTATDEFAYGIAGVNPHYGPARNPWDPERVSGGSSSGSGVAVAAGCVPLALGSDTGGSIRSPSSFCGIVGFKGTWGAISTDRMWAMGRTLDHAGPMARTPADAALLHRVLVEGSAGRPIARSLQEGLAAPSPGMRLGLCVDLELIPLAADVRTIFDSAAATFERMGFPPRDVRFPQAADVFSTFVPIRDAETLYTHRTAGLFPSRREEYSELTYTRLAAAEAVGLDEYLIASARRRQLAEAFAALFEDVDVLLAPLATSTPPRIDGEQPDQDAWDGLGLHMVPENLLGVPACAVRAGFDRGGLPVGVQLVGAAGADALVLAAAQAFCEATGPVQEPRPVYSESARAGARGG
jgi:aspartyl-tRNA(Asn)/glutamyl-tRNA(Gln) amidotransferase subunit A